MARKPVIQSAKADADLKTAAAYLQKESTALALRLLEQVAKACEHISHSPSSGSMRYAEILDIDGLRFWPCQRFHYLVFYREQAEHIDVLRILHAHRDIPTSMII
ncbi:MAG: type II toxin-antitoxin system RelE/ParE family toxin [Pseudomonadota bacterium]